ncbi:MAG: ATP-dependent DNA helicase [Candidatus Eremiobacteraeota bacterium]|nr:ATP-dependent DNA helicase [Candidatus Eremiobacteraeota bacterium]
MPHSNPTIDDVLGPGGLLAQNVSGYEHRPMQIAMAKTIHRSLLENVCALVEAGTGTGKSFGYLVPALLSGQRVVVSTATLGLQEQLLTKDIPMLLHAMKSSATVAVIKGRTNYLCRDKFGQLAQRLLIARSAAEQALLAWGDETQTGDRCELPFVPAEKLWSELDTDVDDCIMEACGFFGPERCHHMRARESARHADLVIVNHALFCIDLAMGGGLIPPYEYAIVDEAHQLEDWATAAFSASLSRPGIGRLLRKLGRNYHLDAGLSDQLSAATARFADSLASLSRNRYPLDQNVAAMDLMDVIQRALYRIENWLCENWQRAARYPQLGEAVLERKRDLAIESTVAHTQTIERLRAADESWVRWVERDGGDLGGFAARCAPAAVAPLLRERLFAKALSVVLTSATIATGQSFDYARRRLGLDLAPAEESVLESPFDFNGQAALFLPPQRLDPRDPRFAEQATEVIEDILNATQGRAFVLFTSHAVMRTVAAALGPRLRFAYRVQGQAPKGALLDWFRDQVNPVLFATASFWEGVDVVGPALSCVIVDRIPFPPPDDPVIAARSRLLDEAGFDSFYDLMVPAAITRLKQGLGRLIRSKSDRGLMCVLDGRLQNKSYGRRILAALPPARRIKSLAEAAAMLTCGAG